MSECDDISSSDVTRSQQIRSQAYTMNVNVFQARLMVEARLAPCDARHLEVGALYDGLRCKTGNRSRDPHALCCSSLSKSHTVSQSKLADPCSSPGNRSLPFNMMLHKCRGLDTSHCGSPRNAQPRKHALVRSSAHTDSTSQQHSCSNERNSQSPFTSMPSSLAAAIVALQHQHQQQSLDRLHRSIEAAREACQT